MTRAAVVGALGKTGRHISEACLESADIELVAAVEREGHPDLGRDLGELLGRARAGVALSADLAAAAEAASVLIEFSVPEVTLRVAEAARAARAALVTGTTGLDESAQRALESASELAPVVAAPNMSVGVNVLLSLLEQASRLLGEAYDLEIFEMHHKAKVDSPSGTALRMAEVVAETRGVDLDEVASHGRTGAVGPRPAGEIGIHAARGGDVVGEHTAIFAGPAERVEIIHRAHGREVFAAGAVRAAIWTSGRGPGLYDMRDVLGVRASKSREEAD